jgi:hypothetical protein
MPTRNSKGEIGEEFGSKFHKPTATDELRNETVGRDSRTPVRAMAQMEGNLSIRFVRLPTHPGSGSASGCTCVATLLWPIYAVQSTFCLSGLKQMSWAFCRDRAGLEHRGVLQGRIVRRDVPHWGPTLLVHGEQKWNTKGRSYECPHFTTEIVE